MYGISLVSIGPNSQLNPPAIKLHVATAHPHVRLRECHNGKRNACTSYNTTRRFG